jgi:thiosulfate dehydrogenase (quinone) large subunit
MRMMAARSESNAGVWPLIVLRGFFGVVYLANGLAKLTGVAAVRIGPWRTFLINLPTTQHILTHDAKSSIGIYHDFAFNVVLPNFNLFGPLIMVAEIAVGLGLLTGVLGRLAALGGMLLALNVGVAAIGGGEWTFEYLLEIVPLACLVALHIPGLPVIPERWLARIPLAT